MRLKKWVKVVLSWVSVAAAVLTFSVYIGIETTEKKPKEKARENPAKVETTKDNTPIEPQSSTITRENYNNIVIGEETTGKDGTPLTDILPVLGDPVSTGEAQIDRKNIVNMLTWKSTNVVIKVTFLNGFAIDKAIVEVKE